MSITDLLETLMILCFGISWPLNIVKAWNSRATKGTSLLFYSFIWIGYIFSLAGKSALIISAAPQPWYVTVKWYVMFFYVVNIIMVTTGIAIYFRNRALDRRAGKVNEDVPATSSASKRSAAKTAA